MSIGVKIVFIKWQNQRSKLKRRWSYDSIFAACVSRYCRPPYDIVSCAVVATFVRGAAASTKAALTLAVFLTLAKVSDGTLQTSLERKDIALSIKISHADPCYDRKQILFFVIDKHCSSAACWRNRALSHLQSARVRKCSRHLFSDATRSRANSEPAVF